MLDHRKLPVDVTLWSEVSDGEKKGMNRQ